MKRILNIFSLLFFCVGCDQSTKYMARYFLEGRQGLSCLGDVFRLSYTENTGAFLGLGSGMPEELRYAVLVIPVLLFLIGFLFYAIYSRKLNSVTVLSIALMIGGGSGNLIDRIMNEGSVIDFMNIGIGTVRTGIFNVADVLILAGMLMFAAFHGRKASPEGFAGMN